ncbi:MAG TPA: ABC transporter permease [Steroidobacteraceae bacterium]|nr:ABC transporter permease [Steroidobacteraceae bacterium]HRX88496.1 ABC transporter permease [Steroidobacteraceae bacterium]
MISITETTRLGFRALLRNKTRAFLTALGIIIGVAAVICMVAIGEGAKSRIQNMLEATGTNVLIVLSGSTSQGGMRGGFGSQPTLTWEDLRAIQNEAPSVRAAAPLSRMTTPVISETATWTTTVHGTTPEYFDIRDWKIATGVGLTQADEGGATRNAVIGKTVAEKLFGENVDPIGQAIRIRESPYIIVGMLEEKGQSGMGSDQDDAVFVPMTTFGARIQGGLGKFIRGQIYLSAISPQATDAVEQEVTRLLREKHRIPDGEEDDFSVRSIAEMAGALSATTTTLSTLLASIALVSLIVGGIGVMNIMLVSVTERTREIGIRLAVGAQPGDILAQFLVEALTLAAIGGIIGVALGVGAGKLLSAQFGWSLVVRPDIVVLALVVSGLVGVIFGLYPARKAARLDPIEALRYE